MEEYIEFDKNAEGRHEYFDGEVFAMAGGSPEHTRIGGNVFGTLREKLRGTNCEAFTSDLRLKVPAALPYRYPDVSVVLRRGAVRGIARRQIALESSASGGSSFFFHRRI